MDKESELILNIDSKPSYTRIPKGTIVEVVKEMPNNYYMVKWNKMFFPVPKSAIKIK